MTMEPRIHLADAKLCPGKIGCQEIGEKTGAFGAAAPSYDRCNGRRWQVAPVMHNPHIFRRSANRPTRCRIREMYLRFAQETRP
jgi:hypothetical protein